MANRPFAFSVCVRSGCTSGKKNVHPSSVIMAGGRRLCSSGRKKCSGGSSSSSRALRSRFSSVQGSLCSTHITNDRGSCNNSCTEGSLRSITQRSSTRSKGSDMGRPGRKSVQYVSCAALIGLSMQDSEVPSSAKASSAHGREGQEVRRSSRLFSAAEGAAILSTAGLPVTDEVGTPSTGRKRGQSSSHVKRRISPHTEDAESVPIVLTQQQEKLLGDPSDSVSTTLQLKQTAENRYRQPPCTTCSICLESILPTDRNVDLGCTRVAASDTNIQQQQQALSGVSGASHATTAASGGGGTAAFLTNSVTSEVDTNVLPVAATQNNRIMLGASGPRCTGPAAAANAQRKQQQQQHQPARSRVMKGENEDLLSAKVDTTAAATGDLETSSRNGSCMNGSAKRSGSEYEKHEFHAVCFRQYIIFSLQNVRATPLLQERPAVSRKKERDMKSPFPPELAEERKAACAGSCIVQCPLPHCRREVPESIIRSLLVYPAAAVVSNMNNSSSSAGTSCENTFDSTSKSTSSSRHLKDSVDYNRREENYDVSISNDSDGSAGIHNNWKHFGSVNVTGSKRRSSTSSSGGQTRETAGDESSPLEAAAESLSRRNSRSSLVTISSSSLSRLGSTSSTCLQKQAVGTQNQEHMLGHNNDTTAPAEEANDAPGSKTERNPLVLTGPVSTGSDKDNKRLGRGEKGTVSGQLTTYNTSSGQSLLLQHCGTIRRRTGRRSPVRTGDDNNMTAAAPRTSGGLSTETPTAEARRPHSRELQKQRQIRQKQQQQSVSSDSASAVSSVNVIHRARSKPTERTTSVAPAAATGHRSRALSNKLATVRAKGGGSSSERGPEKRPQTTKGTSEKKATTSNSVKTAETGSTAIQQRSYQKKKGFDVINLLSDDEEEENDSFLSIEDATAATLFASADEGDGDPYKPYSADYHTCNSNSRNSSSSRNSSTRNSSTDNQINNSCASSNSSNSSNSSSSNRGNSSSSGGNANSGVSSTSNSALGSSDSDKPASNMAILSSRNNNISGQNEKEDEMESLSEGAALYNMYLTRSFEAYADTAGDLVRCTTPGCGYTFWWPSDDEWAADETDKIGGEVCPKCRCSCLICGSRAHERQSCEAAASLPLAADSRAGQMHKRRKTPRRSLSFWRRVRSLDIAFDNYKKTHGLRECVRCGAVVHLESGCAKMRCRCGFKFCYVCAPGAQGNTSCSVPSDRCGTPNATCRCRAVQGHSFLSLEEVLCSGRRSNSNSNSSEEEEEEEIGESAATSRVGRRLIQQQHPEQQTQGRITGGRGPAPLQSVEASRSVRIASEVPAASEHSSNISGAGGGGVTRGRRGGTARAIGAAAAAVVGAAAAVVGAAGSAGAAVGAARGGASATEFTSSLSRKMVVQPCNTTKRVRASAAARRAGGSQKQERVNNKELPSSVEEEEEEKEEYHTYSRARTSTNSRQTQQMSYVMSEDATTTFSSRCKGQQGAGDKRIEWSKGHEKEEMRIDAHEKETLMSSKNGAPAVQQHNGKKNRNMQLARGVNKSSSTSSSSTKKSNRESSVAPPPRKHGGDNSVRRSRSADSTKAAIACSSSSTTTCSRRVSGITDAHSISSSTSSSTSTTTRSSEMRKSSTNKKVVASSVRNSSVVSESGGIRGRNSCTVPPSSKDSTNSRCNTNNISNSGRPSATCTSSAAPHRKQANKRSREKEKEDDPQLRRPAFASSAAARRRKS